MGKAKKILFGILLTFSMQSVYAAACDNSLKVDYQNKAKNISYSYTYNDSNNTFNVLFTNVTDNLYLVDMNTMIEYKGTNEITINNVSPGNSYRYGVFTSDKNPCGGVSIYNIYVTLPFYNPYYKDSLCSGIENYKYCKKFINKSLTEEEFKEIVTNYKNSLNKNNEKDTDVDNRTLLEKVYDILSNMYLKYYFIILPIIIIVTLLIMIRENKKDSLF